MSAKNETSLNAMKEYWRDIPGYEGIYQVSTKGRVKSLPRKYQRKTIILKPEKHKQGYMLVRLTKNKKHKLCTVHRLMAITFLACSDDMTVNHINNKPNDNRLGNLEIVSHKHNCWHASSIGTGKGKLNRNKAEDIRYLYDDGWTLKELAKHYDVTPSNISHVVNNKTWV